MPAPAVEDEFHQGLVGLGGSEAVQVQFGLITILPAPQFAQHTVLDPVAAEQQLVTDLDVRLNKGWCKGFQQRLLFILVPLLWIRLERTPVRTDFVLAQPANTRYRITEQA